jgi:hypothetical protein
MPATAATPLSTVDATRALQLAAINKGNVAMLQLNAALCTDADKGLIYKASPAWPFGLACRVIELLDNWYNSRDTMSLLELKQELNNITITDDEEPAAMFCQMIKIKNRYNTPGDIMTGRDLMSVALKAAPEKYHTVLLPLQMAAGNAMTTDMIKDTMTVHYWINCRLNAGRKNAAKKKNKSGGLDGKYQMAAVNKNKNACWDCGKTGHRKGDSKCPSKGKGLNMPNCGKPNKGKACATCSKIHKGPCWEDPANAHLRPKGWKSGKGSAEVNAAAVPNNNELLLCSLYTDGLEDQGILKSSSEVCLTGLTFPKDINLLQDPNIFTACRIPIFSLRTQV